VHPFGPVSANAGFEAEMDHLLLLILRFFGILYDADERPEARRLTVGCALVFVFLFALGWFLLAR
jgi:hypothetical protein